MSRIGKIPVDVPANVKVAVADRTVTIEGPLGKLDFEHRPEVSVKFDDATRKVVVERRDDERQRQHQLDSPLQDLRGFGMRA